MQGRGEGLRERPGETLHPGIQPLLAQLGVETEVLAAGFMRHRGHWVGWTGRPRFQAFGCDEDGPWLGFQALRRRFDAILLDRARRAGAEIVQPCRKAVPILAGGRAVGVTADGVGLAARFVVDAAGGGHWIARHLGLETRSCSPKLIARYGYSDAADTPDDRLPLILARDRGWVWTAKIAEDRYAWIRLDLDPASSDAGVAACDGDDPSGVGPARGADVTWRRVVRPAGAGYVAVGDAATVLDPASSHGVLRAILSGIMAAHLIGRVRDTPEREAELVKAYGDWLHSGFRKDMAKLRELYAGLPSPPDWCRPSPSRRSFP